MNEIPESNEVRAEERRRLRRRQRAAEIRDRWKMLGFVEVRLLMKPTLLRRIDREARKQKVPRWMVVTEALEIYFYGERRSW